MICSSVNLFFTSNLLSSGLDSRVSRYSNPGGRRHSHDNNAMRLVDDVMEPFRPVIDLKVWQLRRNNEDHVNPDTKRAMVRTLYDDMQSDAGATPVMVCVQKLATSLAQVYTGQRDKLDLPLPGLPLAMASALRDE